MVEVVAIMRGYYGGVLREPDDRFDATGTASWFVPVGEAPAKTEAAKDSVDFADMSVKELRAYAKENGITLGAGVVTKADIMSVLNGETPEPVRVENEVNEALGATQPDWIAPGTDI